MKKTIPFLVLVLSACWVHAKPVCIGETCYLSEEAAIAAGHTPEEVKAALAGHAEAVDRAPEAGAQVKPKRGEPSRAGGRRATQAGGSSHKAAGDGVHEAR